MPIKILNFSRDIYPTMNLTGELEYQLHEELTSEVDEADMDFLDNVTTTLRHLDEKF
jgi:hypothetical protein